MNSLSYKCPQSGQVLLNKKNQNTLKNQKDEKRGAKITDKGWLQPEDRQLIILENAQWKILKGLHQSFYLGVESTFQMASNLFEGKNVMKTLKNIVKRRQICQKNNPKTEKLAKTGLQ